MAHMGRGLANIFLIIVGIGLVACDSGGGTSDDQTAASNTVTSSDEPARIIERAMQSVLRLSPQAGTLLGLSEDYMGGHFADRLDDYSPEGQDKFRATVRAAQRALAAIDRGTLDKKTALTLDVALAVLNSNAATFSVAYGGNDVLFGYQPYMVNQLQGPHINIPSLLQAQHAIENARDAEDYLARLRAIAGAFEGAIATVRHDAKAGVVLPDFALGKTIAQLDDFVSDPPHDNVLYTALKAKLEKVPAIAPEDKTRFLEAADRIITNSVYPAYKALATTLRGLEPKAPHDAGIWAQPGGDALYAVMAAVSGDTELSPDAIHAIGLAEVTRISTEMDRILKSQGYDRGSVGERMAKLAKEKRFLYPDTDDGRAQMLAYLNKGLARILARVPTVFSRVPPQGIEIRRVPKVNEKASPGGHYEPPSVDGGRPGIFWINLYDTHIWPRFRLPTLIHHEAVPGHHFQIALAMSDPDLPMSRRLAFFNSYNEGWALYAERLAAEIGIYNNDPFGNLGRLQEELFRAVRLVVDTGLHAKRWSREQAIDYMHQTTGTPLANVVVEIERYAIWPGQALGYKLGMLKILELRRRAKDALGDKFDIKAFHDVVLDGGAMPMKLLEGRVDAWIAATGSG